MAIHTPLSTIPDLEKLADRLVGNSYSVLADLIYPKPRYKTFSIAKKSGGIRTIDAPKKKIKAIQWKTLALIKEYYQCVKTPVHGFAKGKSIVTNAQQHLEKTFVFNVDLEDFFPSIHFGRVRGIFLKKPFEFSYDIASVLAHICCKDGKLPQGAPTSPVISNLACRRLDSDLQELARKYRATYTRYCDDITFSFSVKRITDLPKQIVDQRAFPVNPGTELLAIIEKHSFRVNSGKVRLEGRSKRMQVTGLTVNEQPNVPRIFVHEIRGMIHAWERYGRNGAETYLASKYSRQLRNPVSPPFHNVLRGKLLFLKMVRGASSPVYARLAARYNSLIDHDKLQPNSKLPISRTVANDIDAVRATFAIECVQDFPELAGLELSPLVSSGTAFIYREKYIVTCWHVISPRIEKLGKSFTFDEASIEIYDYKKKKLQVTVLAKCKDRDVVILAPKFDVTEYPYFSPAQLSPSSGDILQILGFPNYQMSKKVSRTKTELITEQYAKHGVQYIEVKDTIRKGNSGGPVLDSNRGVVGLAVEGATQAEGDNGVAVTLEIDHVIDSIVV
ncbi:MAG: trypsin-like peptidase domain-containing protein [Betaproteobacteria bacterium]|nr:trypsin-like peptidase domain-containing protein [Betaproteobacteria bacterium]